MTINRNNPRVPKPSSFLRPLGSVSKKKNLWELMPPKYGNRRIHTPSPFAWTHPWTKAIARIAQSNLHNLHVEEDHQTEACPWPDPLTGSGSWLGVSQSGAGILTFLPWGNKPLSTNSCPIQNHKNSSQKWLRTIIVFSTILGWECAGWG